MEEVIFLFLYHDLNEVTRRHFQLLQRFHPKCQIVPLAYQLKTRDVIDGTIDVALDWDYGWPIYRSVWHEADKVYMRWYARAGRPRARRYVFFEYDILTNSTAQQFYGTAWDSDVAAATVKLPNSDPRWYWWSEAKQLGAAIQLRCGVTTLAASLWSDEALRRISRTRLFQNCYCELRMGTLARLCGFSPLSIPNAERTISWRASDINVSDAATWFHPVKQ